MFTLPPLFLFFLQAITAAQRRGEDVETTKKCNSLLKKKPKFLTALNNVYELIIFRRSELALDKLKNWICMSAKCLEPVLVTQGLQDRISSTS